MKQRFLALLVCLALALTSCGAPAQPDVSDGSGASSAPPDVTPKALALAAYPAHSFHPALSDNKTNLTFAPLLYEGLFEPDETFTPRNVLCHSYLVSDDGLTWTFTLRGDVTFSDGSALTGETVAAALETARAAGSRFQKRLSAVQKVTAGEGSVTLTLSAPNGNLPVLLDVPVCKGAEERPLGTGPYVLTDDGEGLALELRSGRWRGKELSVARITLREIEQADDLIAAFDAGDVTALDADLTGANALGYSGSYEVWDYPTARLLYVGFNTQTGPCADAEVRQVLARAVDREGIAAQTFAGHARAAALPVHPDSALWDGELARTLAYNPKTLAELKLSRELVLLVNSENTARAAAAERIADQLEAAGLKVTLHSLPFDDYTAALRQGEFDIYLAETLLRADFDLTVLVGSNGALNYGAWRDVRTDVLLSALRTARGEEARRTASQALLTYLNEQAPVTAVCFQNGSVLTQWGRLSGLTPTQSNVFYGMENWNVR